MCGTPTFWNPKAKKQNSYRKARKGGAGKGGVNDFSKMSSKSLCSRKNQSNLLIIFSTTYKLLNMGDMGLQWKLTSKFITALLPSGRTVYHVAMIKATIQWKKKSTRLRSHMRPRSHVYHCTVSGLSCPDNVVMAMSWCHTIGARKAEDMCPLLFCLWNIIAFFDIFSFGRSRSPKWRRQRSIPTGRTYNSFGGFLQTFGGSWRILAVSSKMQKHTTFYTFCLIWRSSKKNCGYLQKFGGLRQTFDGFLQSFDGYLPNHQMLAGTWNFIHVGNYFKMLLCWTLLSICEAPRTR